MSKQTDLVKAAEVYVKVVQELCETKVSGKEIFVKTCGDKHLNFRANDFKRILKKWVDETAIKFYLELFRDLGWIICGKNRFTTTQRIHGQTMRVISVEDMKYQLIRELLRGKEVEV